MANEITPLTPAQTAAEEAQAKHEPYAERLAVAVDKTVATAFGAPPDVTISEAAGVAAYKDRGFKGWYGRTMSRFLGWFQKDHGADATAGGNAQAEQAIEYGNQSGIISPNECGTPGAKSGS